MCLYNFYYCLLYIQENFNSYFLILESLIVVNLPLFESLFYALLNTIYFFYLTTLYISR